MEYDLLFQNINGKATIIAKSNISLELFLESLKRKLEKLYIKEDLLKSNVILDIKNISLTPKEILRIFDVFNTFQSILISQIIYKKKISKNISLYEGSIRAGEIKLFANSTLIIGNINKGSKVIVNGDLFVIGKVKGIVELKSINNKLICSKIADTFIKICSMEKKIEGNFDNYLIKLDDNKIKEKTFTDRSEIEYGESYCNYIW